MKLILSPQFFAQLLLVFSSFLGITTVFGAGELDTSYNAAVSGAINGSVFVFKVQPDGKILVGGNFLDLNGAAATGLGRLNSDLTLDTSFNAPDINGPVLALGLQSDGKIIVGGSISGVDFTDSQGLKRLLPNGQLDTTFHPPAIITTYYDIDILPGDQILAGGMRLNADGSVDNSFTTIQNVKEMEVQSDGKILVATNESSARLRRYSSNGTLDNTFAEVPTNGAIEEIVSLPDGKILFGGSFSTVNGFQQGRIAMLNANGTLDLSFNLNMIGFTNGSVLRIVRQPDGKFKVGGSFTTYNAVQRRYAVLLNADGSLDNSFTGTVAVSAQLVLAFEFLPDGKMIAGFSSNTALNTLFGYNADGTTTGIPMLVAGALAFVNDFALQPDGKLVVVGNFQYSGNVSRRSIARFNTDGSLDTSFVPYYTIFYAMTAVAIQPDGKILVGISNGGGLVLDRLNPNGSRDTGFSSPIQNQGASISDIAVLPDGKFVVASSQSFSLFNANGSTAAGFSPPNANGPIKRVIVQPDGKFVISGSFTSLSSNLRSGFARLNANGSVDTSFNPVGGANGMVNDVAVQADGKVVIGGDFTGVNGNTTQKYVGRLNTDGSLDTTFVQNQPFNNPVLDVEIQADGKILAAGGFNLIGTTSKVALARFNTNGTLDTGFTPPRLNNPGVTKLALQTDGKILIGGPFTKVDGQSHPRIARLLNNTAPTRTIFDYDGDGRADVSVFRPAENKWFVLRSSDFGIVQQIFAAAGDIPVPADYDGDGKTDFAIFRPGSGDWWYLSSINNAQISVHLGQSGDIPRPSDFDGDGKTDFVVYRPSDSTWYRLSSTSVTSNIAFGTSGDQPLVGDFDGDGKSDLAIFRPASGEWWYRSSITGQFIAVHWGASGDIPVAGDYDADGKTDFVVFRPSDGGWYILYTTGSYTIATFGTSGDKPIAADYDGDGKTDIAVWRPSTGTWYLLQTTAGFGAVNFGISTDVPTENAFVP
jgi:uncharacterized delta-60 repeat protein